MVLLAFMVIAIIVTTMAVALVIINSQAASEVEQGETAIRVAESGAENALLRLIRNPAYTGTETLTIDGGSATVSITGTNPISIESVGTVGDFVRRVGIDARFEDTILVIDSWQEVF
ncbi:MAG: hypothetical protein UY49_C0004G0007 [Microgenomates group bacterium GW2011_GWC1_49_7]|nr:MAG: hypothetical protein UY49_C0004G0007 [Microgenomates group bacterium GW2011_GWC1_49_7]